MSSMPPPPPPPPSSSPPPPPPGVPFGYDAPGAMSGTPLGKRRSVGLVILLSVLTCGIWTIVWSYQTGDEMQRYRRQGIGGIGYLFITLLISPVTMFLLAGEVEQMYRDEGREPPITTIWGLWFLLPIIGNIVWYVTIQNALNDYWSAHGQSNDPSL